jgi:hypothetical protein
MSAWVEVTMDKCMSGKKVLGMAGGFESLHLPFSTPGGAM